MTGFRDKRERVREVKVGEGGEDREKTGMIEERVVEGEQGRQYLLKS